MFTIGTAMLDVGRIKRFFNPPQECNCWFGHENELTECIHCGKEHEDIKIIDFPNCSGTFSGNFGFYDPGVTINTGPR